METQTRSRLAIHRQHLTHPRSAPLGALHHNTPCVVRRAEIPRANPASPPHFSKFHPVHLAMIPQGCRPLQFQILDSVCRTLSPCRSALRTRQGSPCLSLRSVRCVRASSTLRLCCACTTHGRPCPAVLRCAGVTRTQSAVGSGTLALRPCYAHPHPGALSLFYWVAPVPMWCALQTCLAFFLRYPRALCARLFVRPVPAN